MAGYTFHKTLDGSFEAVIEKVTEALSERGFGVLTTIDVKETMKKKIGEDLPPYTILGACNPKLAFRALGAEPRIGAMLPCNVIVRQTEEGVEVAAIDPVESMRAVENAELGEVASEVRGRLQEMIESL